jgi:hypothetical protein
MPPVLAARAGGETKIKAIYRGEGGRRLVSILALDRLFREDVMERLRTVHSSLASAEDARVEEDQKQFLIFRLGDDEYGLPIESVDEVGVYRIASRGCRKPRNFWRAWSICGAKCCRLSISAAALTCPRSPTKAGSGSLSCAPSVIGPV